MVQYVYAKKAHSILCLYELRHLKKENEYIVYFQYSKCVWSVSKSIYGYTLCTVHTHTRLNIYNSHWFDTHMVIESAMHNAMLLRPKRNVCCLTSEFWKCLKYHLICRLEQSWRTRNSKTKAASARFLAWAKQTNYFFFLLIALLLLVTKV